MVLASFVATGFGVAGVHAIGLLKNPNSQLHRKAFQIALTLGSVFAILQPIQGDRVAKQLLSLQPAKFAAMEAHFRTEQPASLVVGGIPNEETQSVPFSISIPRFLSFLAYNDFSSEVVGLDQVPREDWPPV